MVLGFEPHRRSLNNIGPGSSASSINFPFDLTCTNNKQ